MKNRILSFVLALVMVLALVPATVLTSSAAGDEKITFTFGNVTVTPGEVAGLDLYVEASSLPAGHTGLVDYEFFFESSEGLSPLPAPAKDGQEEKQGFITADGSLTTNGYMNESTKKMGVTGGTARVATAEAMTAKGGAYLGTIKFTVAEDVEPGTTLTVVGTALVTASYKHETNAETTKISADTEVVFNAGTITVAGKNNKGAADANDETKDVYTIPSVNAAGQIVTSAVKDAPLTGVYGTLIVPSTLLEAAGGSMKDATVSNLVLKNTQYESLPSGIEKILDENEPVVYCHVRSNGMDKTADAVADYADDEGLDIVVKNILAVDSLVDGNNVTVFGNIRVDDLVYDYLILQVKFTDAQGNVRTFESKTTKVYTTLTDGTNAIASTSGADNATGCKQIEGTYLCGLTITGVTSGTYTVETTVYGATPDQNGSPIIVCSETASTQITVA